MNKKIGIFVLVTMIVCMLTACGVASDAVDPTDKPPVADDMPSTDDVAPDSEGQPAPDQPDELPSDGDVTDTPAVAIKQDTLLICDTNGLNVRSGKGAGYTSLGTLDKGDAVAKLGEAENGWYRTVYKERTAYVSAKYVHEQTFAQASASADRVIEEGKKLLGHPYVWGSQRYHWGNGKLNTAFKAGEYDCSALMQYIFFKGAGVCLDLNTRTQVLQGAQVERQNLKRGDLMFFTNASRYHNTGVERVGHVAIYLGDNYILHTASDHAVIEQISATRWSYYIVAKDVL